MTILTRIFTFTAAAYNPTSTSVFIKPSITLSRLVYIVVAHDIIKNVNTGLKCLLRLSPDTFLFPNIFLNLKKLNTLEADAANIDIPPYIT